MRPLLLIALLALLTPCASAQRMVSAAPHFASGFHRGGHPRAFFYPLGFSDPFFSDYLSSTGYPVPSQPPVVIMQSAPAPAPEPDHFPSPAQPLMIELQGDRYVRVSDPETSGAEMIEPAQIGQRQEDAASQRRPSGSAVAAMDAKELAPVVLVFRDGHREAASDYTIADGILYTSGDPYSTGGSWNRKIELSSLNLPETIASNKSSGVPFQLPTAPNEVIVRP
jgi:hypothetical protein